MHMYRTTWIWLSDAVLPFALLTTLKINGKVNFIHIYLAPILYQFLNLKLWKGQWNMCFGFETKLHCSGLKGIQFYFSISLCLSLGFHPVFRNLFFPSRMPALAFIVFKRKGSRESRVATLEKHFGGKGLRKEFSVRNYLGESVTNSFQFIKPM